MSGERGRGDIAVRGFTLVELVVVLGLFAVLASIATLQFNRYSVKGIMEGQIRTLHADLSAARSQALFEKRSRLVSITPTGFAAYSSTAGTGKPVDQKNFKQHLTLKTNPYPIVFNASGIAEVADGDCICIENSDNPAALDSLVLYAARIEMGKRNARTACSAGNIQLR